MTGRRTEPKASRPSMPPEYGVQDPTQGEGLLPWSWAAERLSRSHGHWIATVFPDGGPHLMLVWGVWRNDRFWFATSRGSRKARNLAGNPRCTVCTERADEAVIVEGVAEEVIDPTEIQAFRESYREKYAEDVDTKLFPVFVVRPRLAFGFVSTPQDWAATATRWRFRQE